MPPFCFDLQVLQPFLLLHGLSPGTFWKTSGKLVGGGARTQHNTLQSVSTAAGSAARNSANLTLLAQEVAGLPSMLEAQSLIPALH